MGFVESLVHNARHLRRSAPCELAVLVIVLAPAGKVGESGLDEDAGYMSDAVLSSALAKVAGCAFPTRVNRQQARDT